MGDNLHIVSNLALILISAGVITIIFKLLKQPLVLGYIVAGIIVGPHFDLFPTVTEVETINEWSEIGIIFLLFALGLEFSFKKLFKVGSTAFVAAATEIIVMISIGMAVGYMLNWSTIESVFLGGMLAMSSTVIIIKALDDLKLKKHRFADITMVILIIQDLVAIVMMVLLSTAAVSRQFAGMEMLESIVKLLFFLILWFVVGITIIPTFLKMTKRFVNDETLLIISIGLCFGMVVFANYVGFSSALGAFVMGSVLSETIESEHIENLIKGIKDLFGAIFFVSVGMMVDPAVIAEYWATILLLTFITLFVKAFVSAFGVLIAGQPLKVAMQVGFSLAQIGEFAFIIASLGISLGVMKPFIYPVIVAVSVITTFTTPFSIKLALPMCNLINKILPEKQKNLLNNYHVNGNAQKQDSEFRHIIKISITRTLVFSVLSFAVIILSFKYLHPFILANLSPEMPPIVGKLIYAVVSIVFVSPFIFGLISNKASTKQQYSKMWTESKFGKVGVLTWSVLRIMLGAFFVITILSKAFNNSGWIVVTVAIVIVLFILFSRRTLRRYSRFEDTFIENLNAKEDNVEAAQLADTEAVNAADEAAADSGSAAGASVPASEPPKYPDDDLEEYPDV